MAGLVPGPPAGGYILAPLPSAWHRVSVRAVGTVIKTEEGMRKIVRSIGAAAMLLFVAGSANAAGVAFNGLDVEQGFNFKGDTQSQVGYVETLTVNGTALAADLKVKRPDGTTGNVVGVLNSISWNGGAADPISLGLQISTANKTKVAALLHTTATGATSLKFDVFDYDQVGKAYYLAFAPAGGATLSATIQKSGSNQLIQIATQPGEIASPQNWGLKLSVMPTSPAQNLQFGVSTTQKIMKKWGV